MEQSQAHRPADLGKSMSSGPCERPCLKKQSRWQPRNHSPSLPRHSHVCAHNAETTHRNDLEKKKLEQVPVRCSGTCLSSRHSGGGGRRISSSKPPLAAKLPGTVSEKPNKRHGPQRQPANWRACLSSELSTTVPPSVSLCFFPIFFPEACSNLKLEKTQFYETFKKATALPGSVLRCFLQFRGSAVGTGLLRPAEEDVYGPQPGQGECQTQMCPGVHMLGQTKMLQAR